MDSRGGGETNDSAGVGADPKITEQVKKHFEAAFKADGELDLEALFAMIPKEVRARVIDRPSDEQAARQSAQSVTCRCSQRVSTSTSS